MDYVAKTTIHLPFIDVRKHPGDVVTADELAAAGQADEDIALLVADGALVEQGALEQAEASESAAVAAEE